jgi:hypothetical protein
MRHEHECKICHQRYKCAVITHCSLDSYHKDVNERPVCPACLRKLDDYIEQERSSEDFIGEDDD